MSTRDAMLARIRGAIGTADAAAPSRDYRRVRETDAPQLITLLVDRLTDYGAHVHRTTSAAAIDVLTEVLDGRSCVVPPDLPVSWTPGGARRDDPALGTTELDAVAAVVTTCAAACAETGTIALDAGPGQGRRALTLVPDHHICLLPADRIVRSVPELLARLDPARPLTLISGPSATSDIELQRVQGVHGPRTLTVLLLDAD
ncbi:LutC/YkgG family protein [Nocardia macrotermitis]|uniref:Lactate utilization protein C n=1 Tax=Nocardia macrotermitis TaxID=2585198 RepID=A0A7K0D585_9NOCA|nr:LUD domain-containing protein [Nocardia macrotermitis]MQY20888.1 Lactate utilization protein C [Nocardia macrotermitis]